jgi:acyl carrier protein
VDRRALPALSQDGTALTRADYVAPRDPVEAQLAQLWAEVLRRERVGIYDDFFELGGHSLLATLLVARIRAAFQVELPLRRLFEATTVADLAVLIAQERAAQAEAAEVEALLAELESLSDEDAQRLLAADHQDTHP